MVGCGELTLITSLISNFFVSLGMEYKRCSKCKDVKSIKEFLEDKTRKDGLYPQCKKCVSEYQKKYRSKNKDKLKKRHKEYLELNKQARSEYQKKWQKDNRENIKKQRKQYRENNKLKIKKSDQEYSKSHKQELKEKNKKWRDKNIEKIREAKNERYKNDVVFRLNHNISNGIRKSLRRNKNGNHWECIVGYDCKELKDHIEKQFKEGMTWELFLEGKIHIDHRIPVSIFNITSIKSKGFKMCWALDNLQPMWAEENMSKHNKILY